MKERGSEAAPSSSVAYFVTPHGFGHGGRAAAVMAALHGLDPFLRFEIFTLIPEWFFRDSLTGPFSYHPCLTDIGLVQASALREDLAATVKRLDGFLPFDHPRLERLAGEVKRAGCALLVCDIAPLGIAVAHTAGIPSVLVENFTWDWIYEGYAGEESGMGRHVDYLRGVFESADYHIQTEPVSVYRRADLITSPVSRSARTNGRQVREKLGVPEGAKAVLITMGGTESRHTFLDRLKEQDGVYFVIPGGSETPVCDGNLVLLPHHSSFFHPDLINACDAVVGKLGYSTVAEVYDASVPFGYVPRPRFRETNALAAFARARMNGVEIDEASFEGGAWLAALPGLLGQPQTRRSEQNGAAQAADFVYGIKRRDA